MSTNTELLREILYVVNQHTFQLNNLESRMSTIETRVSTIETRVSNTDAKLSQYIDKSSKIQENISTELIYTLLRNYIYQPVKIHLKYFYNPNGSILTDFDGCLLLNEPFTRKQTNQFKNNSTQIHPDFKQNELIIIEAKRNTTKKRVDTKLQQLTKLFHYLQTLSTLQNVHSDFKTMVKQYRIETWPKIINLIFSTDDISQDIKSYVRMIYNGITKEEYDKYTFGMIRSDLVYQEFVNNTEINSTIKHRVRHSKTLDEMYDVLMQDSVRSYSEPILGLLTPYALLKPCFDIFRGHIGYAQFNTLIFPRILPFDAIKHFWE
jgi:hypothetical protein